MGEILPKRCVETLVRVVNDELVFVEPRLDMLAMQWHLDLSLASM